MDSARCSCPRNIVPPDPKCPIHGTPGPDPIVPWRLSENDRRFLRSMKIDPEDK